VGVFTVLWVIPDVFAFLGFRGISKEQVPLPVGVVPEASGGAIGVTFPEDRRVDAPFPMRKSGCAS